MTARDLGGRIWIDTGFYLRGDAAEKLRKVAKDRGIDPGDEDAVEGLIVDLLHERLGEL